MRFFLLSVAFLFCVISTEVVAAEKEVKVVPLTLNNTEWVWTTDVFESFDPKTKMGYHLEDRVGTDLRLGGWGDHYQGLLRFEIKDAPQAPQQVLLCLYIEAKAKEKAPSKETMTGIEIRQIMLDPSLPQKKWIAKEVTWAWGDKLVSKSFKELPGEEGEVYVVITDIWDGWQMGKAPNLGFILKPKGIKNEWSYVVGPQNKNKDRRPKLIFITK